MLREVFKLRCIFLLLKIEAVLVTHLWTKRWQIGLRHPPCVSSFSLPQPSPKTGHPSSHSPPHPPHSPSFSIFSPKSPLYFPSPSSHPLLRGTRGGVKMRVIKMGMLCSEMKPVQRHTSCLTGKEADCGWHKTDWVRYQPAEMQICYFRFVIFIKSFDT